MDQASVFVATLAEAILSSSERADFRLGGIVVEVKVAGSVIALRRQVQRYCLVEEVAAVLVVTTKAQHRAVPARLGGKPVIVLHLSGL